MFLNICLLKRNDLTSILSLKCQAVVTENVDILEPSSQAEILLKIVLRSSFQLKIIACVLKCVVQQLPHIDAAYVTIHAAYFKRYT